MLSIACSALIRGCTHALVHPCSQFYWTVTVQILMKRDAQWNKWPPEMSLGATENYLNIWKAVWSFIKIRPKIISQTMCTTSENASYNLWAICKRRSATELERTKVHLHLKHLQVHLKSSYAKFRSDNPCNHSFQTQDWNFPSGLYACGMIHPMLRWLFK